MNDFKFIVRPKPELIELIGRFALTSSEHARVFDGHDSGDEDGRARNYGRWVDGGWFRDEIACR